VYPSDDGLTIFYKDITKNKKAEFELSKTIKELSDYKVALDESSIVAITDQKGVIVYVNENFCKISKYTKYELIGKDHRIINSGYHSKTFIRNLWSTIGKGKIWKGEMKNLAKDKTIYWVDTTIVPFLNQEGKPYQYVAIRSDITTRKAAEEKLVKSEQTYKNIASSIPGSVICVLDTDLRYLLIEGDMIEKLGYTKEKLLGNKMEDVIPADIFIPLKDALQETFKGQNVSRESRNSGYDIISRYIPFKDEDNNVYAIMIVVIDVTELKNAQRDIIELNRGLEEKVKQRTTQLELSHEEMEAFTYSVSHDLRAPLRGIVGFTSILETEYISYLDDEAKRLMEKITKNSLKMGYLIDELLHFSKIGKQEIIKSKISMMLLVKETIEVIDKKEVKWSIHSLPEVKADVNSIRQVWVNLLSNAVKYSGNKDQAEIEVGHYVGQHNEDREDVFFVRDNGVGFDERYKEKLFKVFQRLHSPRDFEGTGVGLAIVEKIVTKHDGRVWAEGETNKGATFYFTIPKS
jgi:PAS domain S-box-containing protein